MKTSASSAEARLGGMKESAPRIEDHALIGDLRTAALVTKDGSIDWMCLPRLRFGRLLRGAARYCRERALEDRARTIPVTSVRRRYRKDTLILETDFVTETGTVRLVDFMPTRRGREHAQVCRSIRGIDGTVPMRSELSPRFAFGRAVPRVVPIDGATKMFAGPDALYLRGGPTRRTALSSSLSSRLSQGDEVRVLARVRALVRGATSRGGRRPAERDTEEFWTRWCSTPPCCPHATATS